MRFVKFARRDAFEIEVIEIAGWQLDGRGVTNLLSRDDRLERRCPINAGVGSK